MASQLSKISVLLTITFMIASMAFVGQANAEHTWTEEVLDLGGLEIFNSILFWIIIGIIVAVVIVVLVIILFIKAVHDDDIPISQHVPPPPVYAYPPPPVQTEAPPMYCPNCGNLLSSTPTPGRNYCSKCGTNI